MNAQYVCRSPGRIEALRRAAHESPARLLNGIAYLEVLPGQRRLEVHFVHSLSLVPSAPLTPKNVEVRGGTRVRDPAVTRVQSHDDVLLVEVAIPGDFSRYTLRLVDSPSSAAPPNGIDPALAQIEFSFKAGCPTDFDCKSEIECASTAMKSPPIDYLARDYASFRRLILDRMSTLMPQWRERTPADIWVALSEALAFRGDELAYFQDAVATEAYLGTARQRISVRRHARLLDYPFHDGCNARVWLAFEVDAAADGLVLSGCNPETGLDGTLVLTGVPGLPGCISAENVKVARDAGAVPFELLMPLTLYSAHNSISFHTWSDDECCLPKGATRAFLRDRRDNRIRLRRGDVLVFESIASATTGKAVDADRQHRHAVRLTRVDPEAPLTGDLRTVPGERVDPVTDETFVEIEWADEDALPFSLCLSKRIGGVLVSDMAKATANVTLADHGVSAERAQPLSLLPGGRVPRYALNETSIAPLTQQARVRKSDETTVLVDATASAAAALRYAVADVRPALEVHSENDRRRWHVQRDLLNSDAESSEFVVETGNDGRAVLRFGDGLNGRAPRSGDAIVARVRTGNGSAGNIGAEALGHVVVSFEGITGVRNPMPATGGQDPEPLTQARLYAPQAFRSQERAVTTEDYALMMEREPRVQRVAATRRWTGSWYTTFISVDRRGGGRLDSELESDLVTFIERYRLAGHDVEIDAPHFVPLHVELHVCTRRGYFPADVERRLLTAFSAGVLPNGTTGFFHPDRFTFGQPVHLSAVIATAMQVPGVGYVTPTKFQRLGRAAAGELDDGRIVMTQLEIAQLDNDPDAPENGRIRFDVEMGVSA